MQRFGKQQMFCVDIVADRGDGKARSVRWSRGVARGRGSAVSEHFGTDHKQFAGIKCLPGTDQPLVTLKFRHVGRGQKHCIVASGVQLPVSSVSDAGLRQYDAALRFEILDKNFTVHWLDGSGLYGANPIQRK